jgi:multicomponent Na+:H+ antiporter subunit D
VTATAVPFPVLVPLAAALVTLLGPRRLAPLLGLGGAAATAAACAWTAAAVWLEADVVVYALGGWGAPLGIDLRADGLAAALLVAAAGAAFGTAVYATAYFRWPEADRWSPAAAFWPLALLLWSALNLIFLSGDAFNLYVALEVMTLAAVALMTLDGKRAALTAAVRYLLAAFLGSMAYLAGVAMLYAGHHTLDIALLGERVQPDLATGAAVALITVGLVLKTALFPLHFWLPRAHASAPAPVSAVLSALVVTGSFYLLLRLWFGAFAGVATVAAAQLLGALGAAAIVWGALQALRQQRLKLLVAYSTVSQIGYLFLLFPLATAVPAAVALDAWSGGVYHAASHAFAKAAMFLAAGAIVRGLGHDRIVGISGIATGLPVSTYAFGMAGIALIGLPPSGGFIGKWLLLSAALSSGQWWWAAVILLGGLLTAAYVFLVLGQELSQAEREEQPRFAPVPRRMEWTAMVLALIAVLMGIRALEPLRLIRMGHPFGVILPGAG